jgi:hypothetical protein
MQPLLDQFNDLDAAFSTIRTFAQSDSFVDTYSSNDFNGNSGLQIPTVIGQMASQDFDRAKALADRINSKEVRITTYIEMLRTTLAPVDQN